VYNQFGGGNEGLVAANTWYMGHIKQQEALARTRQVRDRITFTIDTSEALISRTEDGEEYISAVLSDTGVDSCGTAMPEEVLKRWAEQINRDTPVGDVDHEEYDKLIQAGYTNEQVKSKLKAKKGIAKAIKAIVDKGKLWVRLLIDKRYRNVVNKANGLSVEAIVTKDMDTNSIVDGDLLGFTFAVNHTAANPRAGLVI
jgi:hypothetical protein